MKCCFRKVILLLLIFVNFQTIFASNVDEQIFNAKAVTMYNLETTVENMDIVKFGSYPQKENIFKGTEPIEWIVLEKDYDNSRALLLSKYILDNIPFNTNESECTWEDSYVRKWLNENFLQKAFNEEERKQILLDKHVFDSSRYKDKLVEDKVFLLESSEVKKYFRTFFEDQDRKNKKLATKGTDYAKNVDNNRVKLWVRNDTGEDKITNLTNDLYLRIQETRDKDDQIEHEWGIGNSFFWLRNNGYSMNHVARVNSYGGLVDYYSNYSVFNGQGGIRPAVWVTYNKTKQKKKKNVSNTEFKLIKDYDSDTMIDEIDSIKFGKYKNIINGNTDDNSPIEWIVLDENKNDNTILLLSKYLIDAKRFSSTTDEKKVTWDNSYIRGFLNKEFFEESFTQEERNKIKTVKLKNADNEDYLTLGGRDTEDKIFLLSIDEVRKYFESDYYEDDINLLGKYATTQGTAYALKRKLKTVKKDKIDDYEPWVLKNSKYFLRSPGARQNYIAHVDVDGKIYTDGSIASNIATGLRPAMWVDATVLK